MFRNATQTQGANSLLGVFQAMSACPCCFVNSTSLVQEWPPQPKWTYPVLEKMAHSLELDVNKKVKGL